MDKKLQVFVSSTFTDLKEERQAAVESILNAGHIPAGMELFKAGDQSQKETIKKWIHESDAYMLILGGRYGSIDADTGKSYTHWEYDYAGEINIPRFVIVIDDTALKEKVKVNGVDVIERDNNKQLKEFRKEVLTKFSKFYSDIKDIKLTVLESLKEFERNNSLVGWISGNKFGDYEKLLEENKRLLKVNSNLKHKNDKLEEKLICVRGNRVNSIKKIETLEFDKSSETVVPQFNLGETFSNGEIEITVNKVENTSRGFKIYFEIYNNSNQPLEGSGSFKFDIRESQYQEEINNLGYTINFDETGWIYHGEKRSGNYSYYFKHEVTINKIEYYIVKSGIRVLPLAVWKVK